jgi:ABC-2 type transport system permease protein
VRLIAAELLKIRTAPWTALILVLALLAITALGAAGTSYDAADGFNADPEGSIIDLAGFGTVFALILGILVVTWDYRHGTITQTFLAFPRRERVFAAKLVVSILLALALVLVTLGLGILIAEIWLGDDFQLSDENWTQASRIVVAGVLWAVLGLGLGATMQSQVGALITALVWFLVIELILVGLGWRIGDVGQYLPGQVLATFASVDPPGEMSRTTAGLLAAAYTFGFALLGLASVLRRDVA